MNGEYPYLNTYKAIYNIIRDFKEHYRKEPKRIEVLKLLYLVDIENFKARGEKYTELNYIRYNYGPWTKEFHVVLDYMKENEVSEVPLTSQDGKDFYLYSLTTKKPRNDTTLPQSLNDILNRIFFIYKYAELSVMLKAVYTEEPMASTEINEKIDMSKLTMNARSKRKEYLSKRRSKLKKIEALKNTMTEDDLGLFNEFGTVRKRANNLI